MAMWSARRDEKLERPYRKPQMACLVHQAVLSSRPSGSIAERLGDTPTVHSAWVTGKQRAIT